MKSQSPIIDRFQIVGFIISTAIAIGLMLAKQDTIASVTLGLVLAALTQLFDLQLRHSETEERILQANSLSQALYRDNWLFQHVQQIVEDYQAVKPTWFETFQLRADDVIVECRDVLRSLANGYMLVARRSPYAFGDRGIKNTKKSIKATNLADSGFWNSVHGETLLQANIEVMQKGAKITRIFFYSPESDPDIVEVMKKHQSMGIDVYAVSINKVPPRLQEDYILMDDKLVYLTEYRSDGHVKHWRMSINPVEVDGFVKNFDVLMRSARKIDEFEF